MTNDKLFGSLILVGVILGAMAYFGLVLLGYTFEVIAIVVSIAFLTILGIGGWIGWTILSTPTPESIEEIDLEGIDELGEESDELIKSKSDLETQEELTSELKSIPGLTENRIKSLKNAGFTDLEKIRSSTKKDLLGVKGIGSKLASEIKEKFQ